MPIEMGEKPASRYLRMKQRLVAQAMFRVDGLDGWRPTLLHGCPRDVFEDLASSSTRTLLGQPTRALRNAEQQQEKEHRRNCRNAQLPAPLGVTEPGLAE